MMNRILILLALVMLVGGGPVQGQSPDSGPELMQQAQNNLENKNYGQAKSLFLRAYDAFVSNGDYKQAIEAGTDATALYYRENLYNEAFEFCRQMTQYILTEEQKLQRQLYAQRFQVSRERMRMYIKLKNQPQAEVQLNTLQALKNQAGDGSLTNDLLSAQAELYYTFGRNQEGDAVFQKLIEQAKSKKDYNSVSERYQNLIEIASAANNTALMRKAFEGLMSWNDSVKQLTA